MANEIGSTLINSLTNSTFNGGEMAKVIAKAEVSGPRSLVERQQTELGQEQTTLKYLQSNLNAFNGYASDLASPDLFNQFSAESSDDTVLEASVTGTPVSSSYSIESVQTAKAQTIVTDTGYASRASVIDQGTLDIAVGGEVKQLTVDASNNTLEGLQRSINSGDFGVSASIIQDGAQYKLMLSGQRTGADNAFSMSGLTGFNFDPDNPGAGDFTQTSTAQDAQASVNGLTVSSDTNTFDQVLEGVSFSLKSEAPGQTQTLNVSQDSQGVVDAVKEFVDVYNQLDKILDDVGSYETPTEEEREENPEKEFTGFLAGSGVLRDLRSQVRESLSGALDQLQEPYNSLGTVGITIDRNGEMQLDEEKLTQVAENDMQGLSALLAKGGRATDPENLVNVISGGDQTQTGSYDLQIDQVATRAQLTASGPADANITLSGASFDIELDQGDPVTINLADGTYTREELTTTLQSAINNNSDVSATGASIAVDLSGGDTLQLSSERYGANSKVNISALNGTGWAQTGLTAGEALGANVQGKLTMSNGDQLDIGAYGDPDDGRRVKVSDFAFTGSGDDVTPADVRGLEFEVLGGSTGARGSIDFTQGFASRVYDTVERAVDAEQGVVGQRIDSIDGRLERLEEREKELDDRYAMLEERYNRQFSMLQTLLSQSESTRTMLSQTFNNDG